jgi:ABC-type amino acid transport substrate-binding protein
MVNRWLLIALLLCAAAAHAAEGEPPPIRGFLDELTPTGVLRATYNSLNPAQGRFDARTHTVVGPAAEITRELARGLNVAFEIMGVDGSQAVIQSVKSGQADIGFVPYDSTQANDVDFSQVYAISRDMRHTIIVAKGGRTKHQTVERFLNEARQKGVLANILKRSGVSGLEVAPASVN